MVDSAMDRDSSSHGGQGAKVWVFSKDESHKRTAIRRNPLTCEECLQQFYRWLDLHNHKRQHRQENLYRCQLCKMAFTHSRSLETHIRGHLLRERYLHIRRNNAQQILCQTHTNKTDDESIESVSADVMQRESLQTHTKMKEFHSKNSYNLTLSNFTSCQSPAQTQSGATSLQCQKYAENFDSSNVSTSYQKLKRIPRRSYRCKRCDIHFFNHTSFISHIRGKGNKCHPRWSMKKQVDDLVPKGTQQKGNGGSKLRRYECTMCNQGFQLHSTFSTHMMRHSGIKPFKCRLCDKSFGWFNSLDNHRRLMHTKKSLFLCPSCGKAFPRKVSLVIHMRIHTGERPYKCDTCLRTFNDLGAFNKHQRIHTGEKPYQCEECGKRFSRSTTFNRHKRSHTGERPYNCPICGKGFKDSKDVKRHQARHRRPGSRYYISPTTAFPHC